MAQFVSEVSGQSIIHVIYDRSGSTESMGSEPLSALKAFLDGQKKLDETTPVNLTIFDHEINNVFENIPVKDVILKDDDFSPRGTTALYKAIFDGISRNGEKKDVIYVIITDGQDNASGDITLAIAKSEIDRVTKTLSAKFVFLAANQDAFSTGAGFGIQACATFSTAAGGITQAAEAASQGIADFRRATSGVSRAVSDSTPIKIRPQKVVDFPTSPPSIRRATPVAQFSPVTTSSNLRRVLARAYASPSN